MKIAITGNIACGKSTVLQLLRARLAPGFVFGSVDDIIRDLYSDPAYCEALKAEFGVSDKASVSNIVFADPSRKRALERLADRFIKPHFERMLAHPNLVLEFPLLFESAAWCAEFDMSVAVVCDEAVQAQRILSRDRVEGAKLAAIRASQLSMGTKRALADVAIDTGCDLGQLERQIDELVVAISAHAAQKGTDIERELEQRFVRRFNSAGLWQIVRRAYSEAHRFYHVLAHPHAMFRILDSLQAQAQPPLRRRAIPTTRIVHRPFAVESAFWFHDIVYQVDGRYGMNEYESARLMFELLKQFCPWVLGHRNGFYSDIAAAAEMIASSKKHQVTSPYLLGNPELKADSELFLDIDLSILSQSESVVDQFDANIRREFQMYSDEEFATGRAAALGSFLARDKIYFSPYFADREAAARANLQRLVKRYQPESSSNSN
jgi:predicted metal-dependent HD superfamily phosphohydrolase/dephospho-CoA kinase